MKAVFHHELKIYFRSLAAYVFAAFLLIFTGIGALMYNINASVSNFEYVLDFCSVVFVIIVPILTMRVIAEERKQKTDQLLYSLPITTTQVVLGKYLALLVVFLIPMVIISFYPLIFARYGDVFLPTAYGTQAAFFLMGAAFLAVGVFLSSLTDNQGLAAGIGVAVILFNYFSVTLSEFVSATPYSSLVALFVLAFLLAFLIEKLTGNTLFSWGIGALVAAGSLILYFTDQEKLEGLLPDLMTKLSLYKRFSSFVNGIFDMTAVVFYLSVIAFFLFLSVQSLEKRRYN